jgi:hypothetical protein
VFERASALAENVVCLWGVSEPPVPDTLPDLGLDLWVCSAELPAGCSSALFREPPFGSVIWLRSDLPSVRLRIPLWHLIGHVLLHPNQACCVTPPHSTGSDEQEASYFAREVLMPRPWLLRDINELGKDAKRLAERYQVTPLRMAMRLQELGLDGSADVGSHRPRSERLRLS